MGGNASQSEYNLAEELNGLNVEDQGSSNLCWAYAANKALETNIKITNGEVLDFSERYLDYITSDKIYGNIRTIGSARILQFCS